jgi:hypothetical protein
VLQVTVEQLQWQRSWARGGQQDIDDFGKNVKLFLFKLFPWQYMLIDSPAAQAG